MVCLLRIAWRKKSMKVQRALLGNNKGVSEIIASLMLILIVSTAGVLLYSYSLGTFSSSSSLFQLQSSQREERARERFLAITVWWNTVDELNLTMLNYGKIDVIIDTIYVNVTPVAIYVSGKDNTVKTGEISQIRFISPIVIQDSRQYEIVVVSERGTKNVLYWEA
jgi:flagellin-like protein